jgi:hypothetical protein
MNHALEPVVNVLRMRMESPARMTPAHSQSHTTSVDLLIQRVVGLSPRAPMTDDLIGEGARARDYVRIVSADVFLQPFATSQSVAKKRCRTC